MTTSLEHQQRGFACAEEPLDEAYLDALLRRRSARLAELFLKCFRRRLASSSVGLDTLVEQLAAEPSATMWSSALGQLRLALLTDPRDEHRALVAAVSMAMNLAEAGRAVRFEITLERPETFDLGHHRLPAASSFAFHSDGTSAQRLAPGADRTFSRVGGSWVGSTPAEELVRVATGGRPVIVLPSLPVAAALPDGLTASTHDHAAIRARYQSAFDLLARCAPYRTWVERATHAIVPVEARPGTTTSSSFEHFPSVVALSHESAPLAMADALVHEASHQHFYMLTQLGPVDDGSDGKLYFSPARGVERPIDKILLAYHAFANVLLFYRRCRTLGVGDAAFCEGQERAYEECLVQLQRPLETTRALTGLGRALFEPLARRLS